MTETKKTVRALRMNSVRSTGETNTELVKLVVRDPYTGEEMREDDGTEAVIILLQPIPDADHNAVIKKHTRLEKNPAGGRQLFEVVDQQAVSDELMQKGIVSWRGIVAADDRPLVCTDRTKVLLDERVKIQVSRKLFGVEAVEVAAESFR
jgi:hypothetical protein